MFPDTLTASLPDEVLRQAASLETEERYALFLTYVRKAKQVWLLKGDEGFVMMADSETERLPIFPHRDLAQAWCEQMQGNNALADDTECEAIDLASFTDTWLPGLEKNAMTLVIYPATISSDNQVVSASELKEDLSDND